MIYQPILYSILRSTIAGLGDFTVLCHVIGHSLQVGSDEA